MAYEFRIFTNLGAFVMGGSGRIETSDLPLLERSNGPIGLAYRARVVWTGLTASGGKAGTGAYVLTAVLRSDMDLKTGAEAKTEIRRIRFGLMRSIQAN